MYSYVILKPNAPTPSTHTHTRYTHNQYTYNQHIHPTPNSYVEAHSYNSIYTIL